MMNKQMRKKETRKKGSGLLLPLLFTLAISCVCVPVSEARNSHYASATDLQLATQTISSASVGRDLMLSAVQVEGKLAAGRNLTCNNCAIGGNISAGNSIALNECSQVQNIAAGHDAEITHSTVNQGIAAGRNVILHDATVSQRVSAGNEVALEHSEVKGLIALGGHLATLDDSKASDILFSERNQTMGSGIIIGGNNSSTVRVGPTGLSAINGFTVKGAMSQTTVITPEQTIYVNGRKVSGEGPVSYQAYQATNPEAPTVYGPGWDPSVLSSSAPKTAALSSKKKAENKPVVNVLELRNGSTVSGQVQFDSGYGKIVVYPGSQFLGKVVNGFVEKKSR
ncbi:hypothetical protein [Vampirovibrio chlorellavorus]|uniref:hypothetical protein n=1 Tax=Vampirovibrio chlorellavorus TaxID=758823 RepID=UPI0026EE27FD|nr:hypothetical protein [Vampirovibrio chlorellavorus]